MLTILTVLIILSMAYWIVAWWNVRTFFRRPPASMFHYMPPVSILKPARGLDAGLYENFASFCRQDYPEYEILFGVLDPDDPAIAIIRQIQRDFPEHPIRLVVARPIGFNNKVSILHALAAEARYPIFVLSDSDMRVAPDYLRRVVSPLADQKIGLITCLPRGVQAESFGAIMEALELGAGFLPAAMLGLQMLKMAYAFGASITLWREDLERIGGFAAIADYLADDYQVAARIARLGRRVLLSDYLMDNVLGAMPLREVWHRHVRWFRCARVSRPYEYLTVIITFTLPLALLILLGTGFARSGWALLVSTILLRYVVTWLISGYTHDQVVRQHLLWVPLHDLLHLGYWAAGLVGRRVVWKDEVFEVERDGRLETWRAGILRS